MAFIIQLILELIVTGVLFSKLFIAKDITPLFIFTILVIFFIITRLINKFKKIKSRYDIDTTIIVLTTSIILMLILYLVGYKSGFNQNYAIIFKSYLEKETWIFTFFTVLISEFIRYSICCINYTKIKKVIITSLFTIIMIIVDIAITTRVYSFDNFNEFYIFFALILLPSVTKNILLNYISSHYGIKPNLIYRIVMDLYVYFIPVTPKLNEFIESAIYLIYPYFVYTMLLRLESDEELGPARKVKHNYFFDFIFYTFGIIFVMLISREFTYSMIAIGSNSMAGYFNKGDAIVYKKYNKNNELKKGDVIVFNKRGRTVVHRVYDTYRLYDENIYVTKGDANKDKDNWTVEPSDIEGVVQYRVKYIGWPTVLLSEGYRRR